MKDKEAQSQQEAVKKLYAFVIEQMKAGADKPAISQKLAEMGVAPEDAAALVEKIHTQITETAEKEKFTFGSLIPAMIGGGIAAIVGGVIWGLIVISSGFVIGYMALGIGVLCGYAVVKFSRGRKGTPLQVIAVVTSVLGILIGKYFTFFHFLKEQVTTEYGSEAASNLSIFSGDVIQFFFENITSIASGFDILWIFFAIASAWGIPKGIGIKL